MPIENINIIDLIAHDPATDEIVLVMSEPRPWSGSDAQLFEFQEKLNTYLSFVLDGEMIEMYPQFSGKKVRLQLECGSQPDARTGDFIAMARRQISFQEIRFEVNLGSVAAVDPEGTCGCNHECNKPSR